MTSADRSEIDAAFAAHRREQARRALSMSMAERLELEYLAGDIFALATETTTHAALTMNIGLALLSNRERGGRVYSSDLRVRVMATGLVAHPDVTVIRGPIEPDPDSRTTAVNPRVIVEVLSDATEEFDRACKAEHYRQIPSLRACLLVSHRRPHIEVWRRGSNDQWGLDEYGAGAAIELRTIGVTFIVDEIYGSAVVLPISSERGGHVGLDTEPDE